MKKICLLLCCVLLTSVVAYAQLNVIVQGDNLIIDSTGFPAKMQSAYILMLQKCNQCHSIERIIVGVQSGICPLTKSAFNKETTKTIVTRMFLKENSNMTRENARDIVEFLNFLLEQKTTLVKKPDGGSGAVWHSFSSSR
jgi:hypothetical protein